MITNPTVFVLGAGASFDFGLPLGPQLVTDIIALCRTRDDFLLNLLSPTGMQHKDLPDLADTLERSGRPTIDEFLRLNPRFRNVGTRAIAIQLLQCEEETKLTRNAGEDNHYQHIINLMASRTRNAQEFINRNEVTFITFNYDRSFEQYLYTSVLQSYEELDSESSRKITGLAPVLHVHGALGDLPCRARIVPPTDTPLVIPYGNIRNRDPELMNHETIGRIATNLRMIYDDGVDTSPTLTKAKKAICDAKQVVFLGFGYDRDNLIRLIPNLFTDPKDRYMDDIQAGRKYFGSAKYLGKQKEGELTEFFDKSGGAQDSGLGQIYLHDGDCLSSLQELQLRFET